MPRTFRKNMANAPGNLAPRANSATDPHSPLTEMQRLFVVNMAEHGMTQTAAARGAGFNQPGTAALELLKLPKIQQAIREKRAEYAAASQVTKKMVIDGFLESINMAKIKADPLTMVAGWREVGKMCGFYEATKTKLDISVNGQVMIQRLNGMSDEELLKLAEGDTSVIEGDFELVDSNAANPK